jgi:glycosyltransferase involved in cell wall biosynthesis
MAATGRPEPAAPRILACCGGMVTPAGAERMTFDVLGALREGGARVHCILNDWANGDIVPMAERIGASWSAGGYRVRFDRHTRHPGAIAAQFADVARTSAHCLAQAVRFRPTHVFVQDHTTVIRNYPALALLRAAGVACVMPLCHAPERTPFYGRLWRRVISPVVSHFVCNSRFTEDEVVACGIDPRKTSRIHHVLPTRAPVREWPVKDAGKVIFVGQVIPPKGVHVALEAIALLVKRGVPVWFDVVGRVEGWISPAYGDYWDRLKARAAAPDLAGRVRFLGWREDVGALLAGAAVHCCPSLPDQRESFGLVVLEAKAAGVPSVVFPSGALPEHITHPEDGWVCADASPAALADGLEYFLADAARQAAAGEAARRSAARYDRGAFAAAWWAVVSRTWRGRRAALAPAAGVQA